MTWFMITFFLSKRRIIAGERQLAAGAREVSKVTPDATIHRPRSAT